MSTANDNYRQAEQQGLLGVWLGDARRRPGTRITPRPRLGRHEFDGDGVLDGDGVEHCRFCGFGEHQGQAKQAHEPEPVVTVPDEVLEVSARIAGDHEERRE